MPIDKRALLAGVIRTRITLTLQKVQKMQQPTAHMINSHYDHPDDADDTESIQDSLWLVWDKELCTCICVWIFCMLCLCLQFFSPGIGTAAGFKGC